MLSGEWAQPASNTHYSMLDMEKPAVTNHLGSTLTEVTAGHTPKHAHPTPLVLQKLTDISFGAGALASPRGCMEAQKTIPDVSCNQIPQLT